jgi:hypothetical protein
LVSYIQEHGPGNWRSVPNKTGIKTILYNLRFYSFLSYIFFVYDTKHI